MEQKKYDAYIRILNKELVPALGCTEPIAIAYAAAKAREVLGEFPDRIFLHCSGNIIKNVQGVTVPNSRGMRGIEAAATLGVVGGDASKELEVLESVTDADVSRAAGLVHAGFCDCTLKENVENLYIVARAEFQEHYSEVTIINRHTLITRIVKDGEVLYQHDIEGTVESEDDKALLNVRDILDFADQVDIEQVRQVLSRQISCNAAISQEGLSGDYGAQVGKTLLQVYGDDVRTRARAAAAAGSDARMGGCAMPVVINSGSGNQGMTVSLPVLVFAKEWGKSQEELYRALVVSNLIAIHQKKYIGSLSAYCGAVSAACGAGAGIAYLDGGGYEIVSATIVDTICNVGGIVCDGAKSSCAAKISSSVEAALLAWSMAKLHHNFQPGEGLMKKDVESTIKNLGYIGRVGMKETDTQILNIMIDKVAP